MWPKEINLSEEVESPPQKKSALKSAFELKEICHKNVCQYNNVHYTNVFLLYFSLLQALNDQLLSHQQKKESFIPLTPAGEEHSVKAEMRKKVRKKSIAQ